MHRLITLPALIVCLAFLTLNVFSQNRETGFSITVKDQFEGAVISAQISVSKTGDDKNIQAETNDFGIAQIRSLADGEYQITVTAVGFKEYKSQTFSLKNGEVKRLEVVLEIAVIESKVDVGETQSIDPEKSGTTVVLGEKEIESLPDDPIELEKAIRRLGESVTGSSDLTISVNGIQGGKLPPKQAIQQIRINQNVFSAQYDGPFGGGIDIFTRARVKKFSGYLSFNFADSRFNAADPFLGRRVPYQSRNYYLFLLGPLGKKANFQLNGGRSESDTSAVVNAFVLNSNLQPVEFKQSFASPSRSERFSLTINADPTKKHKLYLNYNIDNSRGKGQNVGGFSLPSRANNSNFQSQYLQLSDTYLVNPNIVNQTKFLAGYSVNRSFGGSNDAAINVLDAFFGGGSQQNSSNKNFRFDLSNETTWQMGKYGLGFGWRIRGENINQNSTANFGGTYTFSGRIAPNLDANNNPLTDDAGNFVTSQISSLESYRRTLLFRQAGFSAQRIRELGGGANQFTISGGNPEIKASQYDYAFYVQNSYKVSQTIAASFGVRYENQTNIKSDFNFAPRIGIIWSPKAKEKANPLYTLPRVSLGYGIFYTRFSLNNIISVRQTSDINRSQYLVTDTNILDTFPSFPSVGLLQQFALPATRRFIDEGFGTPYQSLLNLSATKKIPLGMSMNFTFSHGISRRQSFTQNINAPLAGTFDPLNPSTAVRPFGNTGNLYEIQSTGKIKTTRFSVNLNFPDSQKLFAFINYSFSKSQSNIVSGSGSPYDPYNFTQEFAPTIYDGVHRVGGFYGYQLPHKFYVSGDFSVSSGTRFNIFTGRDTNGDGFFSERPSFATDLTKPGLIRTKYGILDPNPSPTDKLIPRNLGRGPGSFSFNSRFSKTIGFHEDVKNKKPPKQSLTFSLNVNNVFNIINRGNPIGNISSPNFLRSLAGNSDGGYVVIINGAQRPNFVGRSMSFNVGLGF